MTLSTEVMFTATALTPAAGTPLPPVTGRSTMPRAGWAPSRLPGPTGGIARVSRMRVGVSPWYCAGSLGGGAAGAVVLTIGIFLPAFAFTLLAHEPLERLVDRPRIREFLEGVTAGVVGLIAATTIALLLVSVKSVTSALVFIVALAALFYFKSKLIIPIVVAADAVGPLTSVALVDGRTFTVDDAGTDVVVLDQAYATSAELAVGDVLAVGGTDFTVIGVVGSTSSDAATAAGRSAERASA